MPNTTRIANLVASYLRDRHSDAPRASVVQKLIDTLFYGSLKTDEARAVSCTVVFLGSRTNLDAPYHLGRRLHRHVYVPLAQPVSLTSRNVAKFSQAAPPWASCIAVREKDDQLEICGLFDQEIHYQNALNREGEPRFLRPGLFQIEVAGTGILTVYDDRRLLAKLSHDSLVTAFHDVLNEGPIANHLIRYIDKFERRAKTELKTIFPRRDVTSLLVDAPRLWLRTLSRILLGIRRLRHGGAVLLIPSRPTKDLAINFPLSYERIETVLERHLIASARWQEARSRMRTEYSEATSSIPASLVQERRDAFNEQEDAKKGELGCAAMVAALAGVDGLILLSEGLRVLGFGVEIRLRRDPVTVLRAGNTLATPSRLKPLSLSEFGTRHRSMMRYCNRHPRSIGFVISQDGDIRAIIKTDRGLLVWENIQLQEVDTEEHSRPKKSQRRAILRRRDQIETQLRWSRSYQDVDKAKGITRRAWLTRSGDPLKLYIHTKTGDGFTELQIFFDTAGEILLAISRAEQQLNGGKRKVEEITRHFQSWQVTEITHKAAHFKRGKKTSMAHVKGTRVKLSRFGGSDTRPDEFQQQSDDAFRNLLCRKQTVTRRAVAPKGDSRQFRFIQGTTSPDGRLALGLSLAQRPVRWQNLERSVDDVFGREHYYVDSNEPKDLIRNYVIDVRTNKIIGETNCHYMGTRKHYNHRTCETVWSPDNWFVVQFFQVKWGTMEATVSRIDNTSLAATDLVGPVRNCTYEFLSRRKDRAFRRFGHRRFAVSISCDKITDGGFITLQVFGEIPKSGEDDSTFNLIEQFRAVSGPRGIKLKFVDCRFGPRTYWP
jgi:sensor domain DACNV-containing protein